MPVHRHPVASGRKGSVFRGSRWGADRSAGVNVPACSLAGCASRGVVLRKLFAARRAAGYVQHRHQRTGEETDVALDMIVSNLSALEENAAMLAAMGRRHADYGAKLNITRWSLNCSSNRWVNCWARPRMRTRFRNGGWR